MWRAILLASVLLSLSLAAGAEQAPDGKKSVRPPPSKKTADVLENVSLGELAKSLTEHSDDVDAIDRYLTKLQGELSTLVLLQPDQAKKELDAAKAFLAHATQRAASASAKRRLATADDVLQPIERRLQIAFMPMADLSKRVIDDPDNSQFLIDYYQRVYQDVRRLSRVQPEAAAKTINEAKPIMQMVEATATKESVKTLVTNFDRRLDSLAESLDGGNKLTEMIGKDAAPLKVDAWVNGAALSDNDLKGKVVFLDFWAVWCGPCIAKFPHLREWNEMYADKGLVIIGVTRYYSFAWDEQAKKASRSEDKVSHEDEQAMLVKFADSHDVKHRVVIEDGRSLSDYYGVIGIPHVVIIDREGKIRLMRVGSGVENAKEIADVLAQLLATKPAGGQ